ncbi:unnamed protein product [Ectocarpus sp. 12 AP-2014]
MSSMARPRTVETSTFVLVLGTLLAGRGGIEAVAPFQSRHVQHTRRGGAGWAHRRGGAAAEAAAAAAAVAAELAPCAKKEATTTTTTAPWRGGVQQSLGVKIAAALRGGRSMRQTAGDEDEESQEDEDEVEDEEMVTGGEEDEEQEAEEVEPVLYDEKAVEWMMQQLCMYQTRTALISNPLAEKGYKLREIVPSPRGLLCAVSTEERRMDCRMYVEAEVGKKAMSRLCPQVVAPCKCKGTQKWISFSALNSERRKEATKWKNCPTCQGPIDYALYEAYGGGAGKAVSAILNNSRATRVAIGALATMVLWLLSPLLHVLIVRVLTSGVLWKNYHRLTFIVNLPLPLQIMGIRFLMTWTNDQLLLVESMVRQSLTDIESRILESRLPVTVEVREDGHEVAVPYRKP